MKIEAAERLKHLPVQFFSNLVRKANGYVQQGYDVINLGQGNPDLPTPPHIVEAMREAVLDPETHKYPPFSGLHTLKVAIANWYKTYHNVDLDPETEVAILFGGKTGLVEISQCLLNPGDVCLVPDPGYPDYWSGVSLSGGEMVTMPLRRDNGFLPDYAKLPKEALKKAKLMFLNYPNNPTGAVANRAFFEDTIRFAEKHQIVVAHDFAYGAIGFDGNRPVSYLSTPGAKNVGVEFYTMSKTYNMAGWRLGFCVGNRDVVSLINLIQDHYYVSVFSAIQRVGIVALSSSQDCVEQLVHTYELRRNVFVEGIHKLGWDRIVPGGSFFTWLPVPKGYTSMDFSELALREAHVVLAPGSGFGEFGEGYVRIGLLADEARLQEAVNRLGKLSI